MQPLVNLALRAARNAAQDLVSRLDRFDPYQSTAQEKAKFIADCSIGLEKGIVFELMKSCPQHDFYGRETGLHTSESSDKKTLWQVAAIDDLNNFRIGLPNYAIMVTCLVNGRPEHAVLVNPMSGDEFSASRGRGAHLNNRRIRCGGETQLANAVIGFNMPNRSDSERAYELRQNINTIMNEAGDIRSIGTNALTLAYVAADRLQGAMLSDMDEFSLNAASLIAGESGCLVSNLSGEPKVTAPADIIATNPRLLKQMIKVLG